MVLYGKYVQVYKRGWPKIFSLPSSPSSAKEKLGVWIPADLLCDTQITPLAKYLYMLIRLKNPRSFSELSRFSKISRESIRLQCKTLEEAGWVVITAKPGQREIIATAPRLTQETLASRLKEDRWESVHVGEFLMKAWLDLLVDSDNFVDNSRPPFLAHPVSGELLEYDRYYRAGVAFEYNGRQHYETTSRFPDEGELQALQLRDHVKASLSQKNGVALVVITEADLTLENMRRKIPNALPLRPIDEDGLYVRMLTRLSEEYIANCKRLRSRERSRNE